MGAKREFKPNMSYAHNKYVDAYFRGDVGAMYSTDETIDTFELQTEFGKYVAGGKVDIMRSLMGDLTDTKFMTTIVLTKQNGVQLRLTSIQFYSSLLHTGHHPAK